MSFFSNLLSRRAAATLVLGSAALVPPSAAAADVAVEGACENADARPADISVGDYAAALQCEVNVTRREYGRDDLVLQTQLRRAASWHAEDMEEQRYFSHTSADGDRYADRLDAVHFIPSSNRWRAGENLAAGEGGAGTPAAITDAWMRSPEHRVNLLDSGYSMVGIGVARGMPTEGEWNPDAMTITMDLGWRAPRRR